MKLSDIIIKIEAEINYECINRIAILEECLPRIRIATMQYAKGGLDPDYCNQLIRQVWQWTIRG